MPEPRIVTPDEAQHDDELDWSAPSRADLLHTTVTEPDRTRVAVVKAYRNMANQVERFQIVLLPTVMAVGLRFRADAIEKGANW